MARYTGPVCRLCRRERTKLFLKGARCESSKCAMERKPYPPGEHGRGRIRESQYLIQLREKQKARRIYGVLEKQFRKYYREAASAKGITGESLLVILESRLDNIVYRLGFAASRKAARQLVRHNHITVNGKRVSIPSYLTRTGDVVQVTERSRQLEMVHESLRRSRETVSWLAIDKVNLTGTVSEVPSRDDIPTIAEEQLVIEFYSRV